jgi:hypothetical protein
MQQVKNALLLVMWIFCPLIAKAMWRGQQEFFPPLVISSDSTPRASTINYCGLKEISEETTIQKMERMKKMFEETAELLRYPSH